MRTAVSAAAAAALVPDGASVMIGGFMGVGSPHRMIDALVERGARDLTVIANDTARPGVGIGKLIDAQAASPMSIASHIGTNPETQKQMLAGELEVELVPQGTLAERIRAGGVGPRRRPHPDGARHDWRRRASRWSRSTASIIWSSAALKADVRPDRRAQRRLLGNLVYSLTARNFNPLMAMAAAMRDRRGQRDRSARRAAAGCDPYARRACRPSGRTPETGLRSATMDRRELIARRVALELHDNTLVNLGIGLPTLVANYVPQGYERLFPIRERHHRLRRAAARGDGGRASDRCGRRLRIGAAGRRRLRFARCPSRSSAAAISI